MNDNDLRTPSHDDYKRLMAEAYPSPKTDIKAAVMAQIAAEAEQSNKKAKILTPERRNRFVKFGSIAACFVLLVTLGFRVVPMMTKDAVVEDADCAMGVAVTADMAPAEALPETAAGSITSDSKTSADGGTGILFKSMRNGESGSSGTPAAEEPAESPSAYAYVLDEELDEIAPEAEAVENDSLTDDSAEEVMEEPAAEEAAPVMMAAPAPEPEEAPAAEIIEEEAVEEAVMEAVIEEEAVEEEDAPDSLTGDYLMGYAGSYLTSNYAYYDTVSPVPKSFSASPENCPHSTVFGNSFHDIPQTVVNLVLSCADAESVAYWYNENAGTCGMNIYDLVNTFSVPRTLFEAMYTTSDLWYHHDYSIDLLYGGDRSAADAYYQAGGNRADYVKRYFEYELKLDLYGEAGSKAYNAWAAERDYTSFCQWSMAEFVRDFGVSRERFTELYDALAASFAADYAGYDLPVYDLDILYGMGADITESIAAGSMGYITDALYRN